MVATQIYTAMILIITFTATAAAGMQEVCQWETFQAKCQEDEVIVIKEARYGRMRFGRCQHHRYFVGCSADVSTIMHGRCSGRQHCSVPVPDPVLFAASPCNKDLVSYLEADYECVKVTKNTHNCGDQILTDLKGNIAKPITNSTAPICPHRILTQPGQTVNVYLYDFFNKDSKSENTADCITYGHVSEGSNPATNICGGKFLKKQLIYSSNSNVVDIKLSEASSHSHHYLLHYEIVGCPTLNTPHNAFVKIQNNKAVVMCNFSHIASELVCFGNEWVGDIHNCTSSSAKLLSDPMNVGSYGDIFANSNVFPIACVAAAVLFSIGVLIILKARHMKAKQIAELPESSLLEKPVLPQNEKYFMPVEEYQPVYLPVNQNTIHGTQHLGTLSTLEAHIPVVENIYGPLNGNHGCSHSIYNITGLSLGEDNVINMEDTVMN